jgi:c-di-GMP-binding flagellar brake protein YcgR
MTVSHSLPPEPPDYTLRHPADILQILDRLHRERTLTTMEFGDGHAIVSRVLDVRRDDNAVVFDVARDTEANAALFSSARVSIVTELDHIQIAFETGAPMKVAFSDGPAAVVDLPQTITRLQRREWFRAELPLSPPIRCTVLDASGNASPAQALDLSCGGAALVVDDPTFTNVEAGTRHELVLSLPEVGRVALDATLCTVRPSQGIPTIGPGKLRLGFRFERVPGRTSNQIQRYVQRLEVTQLRVLRLRNR